jgi:hypothetical protein
MENRSVSGRPGGGSGPPQRVPSEWEKQSTIAAMNREPDQGPAKTTRPTMRSMAPGLNPVIGAPSQNFSRSVIDARPGAVHQRAQAPIPGEVVTVLEEAPGGFTEQHLAGVGSFSAERAEPGNDDNVAGDGDFKGGLTMAAGSATRTTGHAVKGQTGGKGTI